MAEQDDPKNVEQPDPNELTDEDLAKVAGGFAPQPEPPVRLREGELPADIYIKSRVG